MDAATTATTSTAATPAGPAPGSVDQPFYMSPWFGPGIIVLVMLLVMSKAKPKAAAGEDLLKNLKRGDRIQTIGGVLGIVADVRDDEITIKVDESSNTRIRFSRDAIRKVIVDQDKADKNADPKK
jgi:preprotein translocase subunit YajC